MPGIWFNVTRAHGETIVSDEEWPEGSTLKHIDLGDEQGLALWSIVLGVSVETILTAVEAVGPEARKVQAEIEAHPHIYKRAID